MAHVVPSKSLALAFRLGPDGADQADATLALERERGEEVALVHRDVKLAVDHWPTRVGIGHIEQVLISTAGKPDPEPLTNRRACPVAPSEEGGLAARRPQLGNHAVLESLQIGQRAAALDLNAELREAVD